MISPALDILSVISQKDELTAHVGLLCILSMRLQSSRHCVFYHSHDMCNRLEYSEQLSFVCATAAYSRYCCLSGNIDPKPSQIHCYSTPVPTYDFSLNDEIRWKNADLVQASMSAITVAATSQGTKMSDCRGYESRLFGSSMGES